MLTTFVLLLGSVSAANQPGDGVRHASAHEQGTKPAARSMTPDQDNGGHRSQQHTHHPKRSNGSTPENRRRRSDGYTMSRRGGFTPFKSIAQKKKSESVRGGEHRQVAYLQADAEYYDESIPETVEGVPLQVSGAMPNLEPYGAPYMQGGMMADCGCGGPEYSALPYCACLRSTCNMPQHMQYFPAAHGYYYFRPYNYFHIYWQQDFVVGYGGDPRDPYDNRVFNQVYAMYPRSELCGPIELDRGACDHRLDIDDFIETPLEQDPPRSLPTPMPTSPAPSTEPTTPSFEPPSPSTSRRSWPTPADEVIVENPHRQIAFVSKSDESEHVAQADHEGVVRRRADSHDSPSGHYETCTHCGRQPKPAQQPDMPVVIYGTGKNAAVEETPRTWRPAGSR